MAKTKNSTADIIISGGGIAGLTFALLMANLGLDIHLIDPSAPPPLKDANPSGRTVALMQSSLNIIKAAGLDTPEKFGAPLKTMRIIDNSIAGQPEQISDFESSDIGMEAYGYNIPNSLLRSALYELTQDHKNITLHVPQKLHDYSVENEHVTARLENETQITAPLIVGADGRKSLVRTLAGIDTAEKNYGQSAMTFIINHSKSHQNIATEFHRPSGPLALVPMQGNQCSVVWVEKTPRAEELVKIKKQDFEAVLQDAIGDILGTVNLETGPAAWPLCSIKAKSLTACNVALIAEAAHVMSPITAQGLNLSLRDVAALAEVLADGARAGLALSDATLLKKYEKRRRLDLNSRIYGVDGMMRLVSNDILPLKGLRRGGFKLLDALPPLKQLAMTQGLAPPADKGRLANGEWL